MNLFILSLLPKECAEYMMDKHVSKIIIEAVQMLCTAKRIVDPDEDEAVLNQLYKITHKNHPVTIWCRASRANFEWTLTYIDALHEEWKFRYGHPKDRVHKSYEKALILKTCIPVADKFPNTGLTQFALAMPDEYKIPNDPIQSYKNYYMSPPKQLIATWKKKRAKPDWYIIIDKPTTTQAISAPE